MNTKEVKQYILVKKPLLRHNSNLYWRKNQDDFFKISKQSYKSVRLEFTPRNMHRIDFHSSKISTCREIHNFSYFSGCLSDWTYLLIYIQTLVRWFCWKTHCIYMTINDGKMRVRSDAMATDTELTYNFNIFYYYIHRTTTIRLVMCNYTVE